VLQILKTLDRRWIFLIVLLSAVLPLLFPLQLPAPAGKPVRALYDALEALPSGSVVLCSFDFEPGTEVELKPAAIATLRQLFQKGIKVVGIALWPAGASEAQKSRKQPAMR